MKKKKKVRTDPSEVYLALQIEAVFNAITNNRLYFERKVRRWFSKNFNTPLKDTYKIAWDEILIHYYESALEDKSFNQVFDIAVENYLPEFIDKREEEDRAFAESLLEEQKRTLAAKNKKVKAKTGGEKKAPEKGSQEPKKGEEIMSLNFDDSDFEEDQE